MASGHEHDMVASFKALAARVAALADPAKAPVAAALDDLRAKLTVIGYHLDH